MAHAIVTNQIPFMCEACKADSWKPDMRKGKPKVGDFQLFLTQIESINGDKVKAKTVMNSPALRGMTFQQAQLICYAVNDKLWELLYPEDAMLRDYLITEYPDAKSYPKSIRVPLRLTRKMMENKKFESTRYKAAEQLATKIVGHKITEVPA